MASLDARAALAGRHLLLTGVTGFLGKVWLLWLLDRVPEIGRVTVIVRPRPGQSPADRLAKTLDTSPACRPLKARHGARFGAFLRDRVDVVRGNVERPLLGLDDDVVAALAGSVDVVVNVAGLTDFEAAPGKALATNTHGAVHAADLAAALGARLVHVSTTYVAGDADGTVPETLEVGVSPNGTRFDPEAEIAALLRETALPGVDARQLKAEQVKVAVARARALGWPNVYTYTKGLAEHLVLGRDDVDVTVARPAILECARSFPFVGWNEGLNTSGPLSWLISTAFRRLPAHPEHKFDVVPIDDAARALLLIVAAVCVGQAERVYQIASSDTNPLTFGRCIELNGLGQRRWVRKSGGSAKDWLLAQLDPVPGHEDPGVFTVPRLTRWARRLGEVARDFTREDLPKPLRDAVGGAAEDRAKDVARTLGDAHRDLSRVEDMLRLYKPFIHDKDYAFRTDRTRALTTALPEDQRAELGFDLRDLDWRHYWVDVEYPGLQTWCIPLIHGETAPVDRPSDPPLSLAADPIRTAVAS